MSSLNVYGYISKKFDTTYKNVVSIADSKKLKKSLGQIGVK